MPPLARPFGLMVCTHRVPGRRSLTWICRGPRRWVKEEDHISKWLCRVLTVASSLDSQASR
jgi:hypothetical protein